MSAPGSDVAETQRPVSVQEPARPTQAEPPLLAAMRCAPPLAALAVLAALADLAWNRIGVRLVDPDAREVWIPLVAHGRVLRNLTGIAALVASLVALFSLVRIPGPLEAPWKSLFGRLTIAGIAGLYLPGVAVALVAPREHVPSLLVALGLLSGNALVAVLASSSLSYARVPAAWASMLAGLTALLAMIGLLVASLRTLIPIVGALGLAARHGAEMGWLLTPLVLYFDRTLWPSLRLRRGRTVLAVAVGASVLLLALGAQASLGDETARIAYGAFRVAMLPAGLTWAYGLPVGLGLAFGVFHATSPTQRQLGLGVLAWIAAGLAPRSPLGTLVEVVAALLLARAAVVAHPEGRARLVPYQGDVERVMSA
ncbi:MAG: hypothetical protein J0L92_02070 [Deltaproteobacteria bacterium]|nr:hypothetical protein [Deltaproteobacteria bacterium]